MNITEDLLLLLIGWAVGATILAYHYRGLAQSAAVALCESMRIACEITKNEKVRKDFETQVVDPLLAKLKEKNT